jgi:hypothetical protein
MCHGEETMAVSLSMIRWESGQLAQVLTRIRPPQMANGSWDFLLIPLTEVLFYVLHGISPEMDHTFISSIANRSNFGVSENGGHCPKTYPKWVS